MEMIEFLEDAFNKVGEFHEMIEAPVSDLTGEFDLTQEDIDLRYSLMEEETGEVVDAYAKMNKREVIDGFCDSLIVALGTMHTLNVDIQIVCEKLENVSDDLKEDVASASSYDFLDGVLSVCEGKETIAEMAQEIVALFIVADMKYPSLKLKENFYIIHETNMLKSFDNEEEAEYDATLYRAEDIECDVFEVGYPNNIRYVIRRDDGKLLKNREWKEPELIVE